MSLVKKTGALKLVATASTFRTDRKPLAVANEQNEPRNNPIGSLECNE